ncbi:DMT family transporter [Loktanella sp. S4079]|uniref:DMT family transporter n=1 Tax=Loktanella sp. S4079 TaxID=579483 RepID=UPI0005FA7430|nr:DMT family transporter [Loktanella sp. S4079]KJZ20982.1 multidrug DMT transporter permease [Loktanella sp. S4079]
MNTTLQAGLWMLGAIVSFTSMAIAGRAVSFELDTFEIMLFRSLTGIVVVVLGAWYFGTFRQIKSDRIGLHFLRNLFHFTGQNLWFFAIASIPLAQVFALEFTTPIWVLLLSPLVLRERMTLVGIMSASLGFIGVLIVTRPDTATLSPGLVAGATCAIFFALTAIFTRKLTITQPITSIMFYLTTMQAIFGLICAGYDGDITVPSVQTAPMIILIGFAGLFAHFCLTRALSLAPASIVMPMDFVRLPTIAIVGMIVFHEQIQLSIFAGAVFIFAANYLNIMYSAPNTK